MKVYHVYTCGYEEPWYPNEDTAKIYGTFEKAKEYANKLVSDFLEDGYTLYECEEGETPMFKGDDSFKTFIDDSTADEQRIYIDEYEVE